MRPFNTYVGRGDWLDDYACPACDRLTCACTIAEQVEAARREDDDDGRR